MATQTAQAQEFIEALEHDSRLQAQFSIASPNNLDGVVDFANSKGFMITQDELQAALRHFPNSSLVEQLRQYIR
jgi:predicted ribosomally synthesized peptide with nif11-like leader